MVDKTFVMPYRDIWNNRCESKSFPREVHFQSIFWNKIRKKLFLWKKSCHQYNYVTQCLIWVQIYNLLCIFQKVNFISIPNANFRSDSIIWLNGFLV